MKKARQAGALYEGKEPSSSQENPRVAGSVDRKIFGFEQRKGNVRVEMPLMLGEERESLRGSKTQESIRPLPDLIHQGSTKGTALSVGASR